MSTNNTFGYGTPYDLMIGLWNGISTLYSAKGVYQFSTPSLVSIYWKDRPSLLSYRQIEEVDEGFKFPNPKFSPRVKSLPVSSHPESFFDPKAPHHINNIHFDAKITGKYLESIGPIAPPLRRVEGTETRPDTYIFLLTFDVGGKVGRYYNNQYFVNPSERHIIGPFIRDGSTDIAAVIAQIFTRISYEVPDSAQSDIKIS